jgi:membrane protein
VRTILRQLPRLLRRALTASFNDGLFTIAKGAAYSALLSLFPVLASVATIFVQTHADYVRRALASFLTQILPPGTEDVVLAQFRYRGQRPIALLVVAFALSLWAASSVIKSLIDGFNAAYRVPRNRTLSAHAAVGIMLVFLSAIPLVGASLLILFGGTIQAQVLKVLKVDPVLNPLTGWWELLSRIARYVVAFVATSTFTAILYFYGPYRRQQWRFVWPGAFLATTLWLLATIGFGWYVRNITNYNLLYGSVGTSIALLVWMYLIAAIALYGCAFNAECERALMTHYRKREPAA